MKGNNFFLQVADGSAATPFVAIPPNDCNNETVAGNTISEPWNKGRQLAFLVALGAVAAGAVLSITVQGLRRDDGATWEALKESDGVTDLKWTAAELGDADDGKGGVGTLDLTRIDGETYKAIRLSVTNAAAFSALVSASYVIFDLLRHPSDTVDQLFTKQTGQ